MITTIVICGSSLAAFFFLTFFCSDAFKNLLEHRAKNSDRKHEIEMAKLRVLEAHVRVDEESVPDVVHVRDAGKSAIERRP